MPALDSLLPEYQAQYEALMPEIERKVRQDLVRRGMSYSGNAGDTLARAQAQFLAELAAKSAETNTAQQEAQRQRQFAGEQASENRRAEQRAQRLSLLGSTVGGLGTLGAMYAMRPAAGSNVNIVPLANGGHGAYDPVTGTIRPIPIQGAGGDPAAFGGAGDGVRAIPGAAPGQGGALPQPSMWQKAGGFGGLAGGAAGGLLGSQFAGLAAGRNTGAAGAIGSGLGGLAGYAGAAGLGYGAPWQLGLGALAGSFGGGLLGNLFK